MGDNVPGDEATTLFAGLTLLLVGLIGTIVNAHNFYAMCRMKEFQNSYGYLSIARAVCNIVNLLVFVLYTSPNTMFNLLPDGDNAGRILGLISGVFYSMIPILQVAVAYNRAIAIFFPFRYDACCNKKWAMVVIAIGLLFGSSSTSYDLFANCHFVYSRDALSWIYLCPKEHLDYIFNYPMFLLTAVTVVVNICIAVRIVIMRLTRTFVSFSMKKNVLLFWQGFVQEVFFVNDTLFQRFLGDLIDSRLWWFFSYTFIWEIAHTCDGIVFLIFDAKLRNCLWRNIASLSWAAPIFHRSKTTEDIRTTSQSTRCY